MAEKENSMYTVYMSYWIQKTLFFHNHSEEQDVNVCDSVDCDTKYSLFTIFNHKN